WERTDSGGGFDLTAAPLMRLALLPAASGWRFVWTHHHAILDGWSLPVLFRELFAAYAALRRGAAPPLPPARSYRDYIAWLGAQDLGVAETFWRAELSGFSSPTPVGAASAARGGEATFGRALLRLPDALSDALRALAARHQLTVNTLFQTAWGLWLSRQSGES